MIIGQSPEMVAIKHMIRQIPKTGEPILIVGEAGAGKEHVARQIHHLSDRKNRPFVILNCTAVGDTLTDADLYGESVESANSVQRKIGLIEQAHKGMLYLDRVDELNATFQLKLVNLIRGKKIRRPGDNSIQSVDIRIIAGTENPDLGSNRLLRSDLFALLSKFTLNLPSLRERKQDIPTLFSHFLEHFCREYKRPLPMVPAELFESLMEYDWRGNVQELKNAVRNLVVMSPEGSLSLEYLPFEIKKHPFEFLEDRDLPQAISEVEKYLIHKALQRFAGNQTKAAKALKISEAALRYKMKKYRLSRETF
jgi:DNA-binding NtrC family response regulator